MTVNDKIVPYKRKWARGNTQTEFDGEMLQKLNLPKFLKKFKKSRIHIDKELYKKSKYDCLVKPVFFEEKLSERIGKLKGQSIILFKCIETRNYYFVWHTRDLRDFHNSLGLPIISESFFSKKACFFLGNQLEGIIFWFFI